MEQERELYKNAATKLSTELSKAQRKTKTPLGAIAIDFDAPDRNKEVESLKIRNAALLERLTDEHKDKVFKRWQRKVWWNLFWVVPITAFFLVLIFNTSIMFPGGFDTSVQKIVFTGIITVVDGVFGFLVKSRYFDEGNMDKRKQRIKTPSDLKILNN